MDRNSIDWSGVFPGPDHAVRRDGRIDEKAFAANVDRLIDAGANGFVVAGCTGEFWALSHEEREALLRVSRSRRSPGRVTLIVGTGAVTVDETVKLTNMANKAGATASSSCRPISSSSPTTRSSPTIATWSARRGFRSCSTTSPAMP